MLKSIGIFLIIMGVLSFTLGASAVETLSSAADARTEILNNL